MNNDQFNTIINAVLENKPNEFATEINSQLNQKLFDRLEIEKVNIKQTMFDDQPTQ